MTTLPGTTSPSLIDGIGSDIFAELRAAQWVKPSQRSIEELGSAIGSNIGPARSRNEDRVVIAQISAANREQYSVAIVCDGVGGSEMGDAAATIATATLLADLAGLRERRSLERLVIDLIRGMDDSVRTSLNGRGTTTVALLLGSSNGQVVASNIGDSRVFSWTPGEHFQQLSVDDTFENELRSLPVKDPSVLDARGLRGSLTQAIGESGRTSESLQVRTIGKNEFLKGAILATDGSWRGGEEAFRNIGLHAGTATDAMRRILAMAGWTGGADNASIVAVEDVALFSKAIAVQLPKTYGACAAAIWICGTKVVLRGVQSPSFGARRPYETLTQNRRGALPEKRTQRKSQYGGKTSSKNKVSQLSLIPEKEDRKHPKVEVSGDAEPGEVK